MKKPVVITIIILAVLAIAGGAYWLGTRSNTNANVTNQPASNANVSAPNVIYETNSSNSLYVFDMVKEWTSVTPEEVQKSIPEEQRHGYSIMYFSTNPDSVVLSVSEKGVVDSKMSMAEIVADDKARADKNPNADMTNESVNQSDARTEIHVTSGANQYTVFSRYLIFFAGDNRTSWALMEVTVPTSRVTQYKSIVTHLLDSLQIAGSGTNTNRTSANAGFSASGEKVNDRIYSDNFASIELGTHKKNDPPQTASYGISRLDDSSEDLAYSITTTNAFPSEGSLTLKVYDYAAGKIFGGEQKLDAKRGSNGLCCFSPPGKGRYQYLFYYGNNLVKTLELISE